MISLPTCITWSRIVLSPCIMYCIAQGLWGYALGLFAFAALSDVLDGALARWLCCQTFFGACLDALADKILLIGCFWSLYIWHPAWMPGWFLCACLSKDVILIIGSCAVGLLKGWHAIRPTAIGKLNTLGQVCYIIWVFSMHYAAKSSSNAIKPALIIMLIALSLTLLQYCYISYTRIINDDKR